MATDPQDEFEELMADDGLTEEKLQAKLEQYQTAIQQEYEIATQKSPENVDEYTTKFFRDNTPLAAAQIVWLAHNADSESVRANLLKYIIEQAKEIENASGDPIKDLIASLKTKSKATH